MKYHTRYRARQIRALAAGLCLGVVLLFTGCAGLGDGHRLSPDPALITGTLDNGFSYIYLQNAEPPDRVSLHLVVDAGSFHETEDQRGLAHYLEHMVFNGSDHFKPGELVTFFQRIGMDFGGDANAHTGFYQTVYDVVLPDDSPKHLADGFLVLRDYACGALLPEAEVDRERGVILAEKRSRDTAGFRVFEQTFAAELPGHRLARRMPIGLESVIKAASAVDLRRFYDTWYRPERMTLIVVGDVPFPVIETHVKAAFSDMTARAPAQPVPDAGQFHHTGVKPIYVYEKAVGNTTVSIETLIQIPEPPDTAAELKRRLMRRMASRIIELRLEAREGKPDTPYTTAQVYGGTHLKTLQFAEISAECAPDRWADALEAIEQELRKALAFGFSETEADRVKAEYTRWLTSRVDGAETRQTRKLASDIMRSVKQGRAFLSPDQEAAMLMPFLATLTASDLHTALQALWKPDHRLVLVTGTADLGAAAVPPEQQILDVYANSGNIPVTGPEEGSDKVFPYLPEPKRSGSPAAQTRIADLDIRTAVFANGNRVDLKPTDFQKSKLSFCLELGGGRRGEPADKPGLAWLAAHVVNNSGLGTLEKADLESALAGVDMSVRFHVDDENFAWKGTCAASDFRIVLQYFYAQLKDPGFRESALRKALQSYRAWYDKQHHSVEGELELSGRLFFAGGDSRFRKPAPSVMETYTLSDITAWLMPVFETSACHLVVVGDMDPDAVIAMADTYLGPGALPDRNPFVSPAETTLAFPAGETRQVAVDTHIDKSIVSVAFPTDDFWDIERTRGLVVLAEIFSDQLRQRVREALGAAYSPYAYHRASRIFDGYGLLQATVKLNPPDAKQIASELRDIAAVLSRDGVTEEAVTLAVNPINTRLKDWVQDNRYWRDSVLSNLDRHPQQADWARTFQSSYASMTAEAISKLATTYLIPEQMAILVVAPTAQP
ncbi:MAG: peptidase M16 [Deltaproteobacteria bacterium]|nr:MAG: peptidase M16 [Deltaproteobacteria bacterium]